MESLPLHPSHLKASDSFSTRPKKLKKSVPSEIRLTDLCAEDKARIGELVKRLALEKSQREETESKLHQEKKQKEKQLHRLTKENERIRNETRELKTKYDKSLEILETYKQSDQLRSSWKEWERPNDSHITSNVITQSMRATPEHIALANIPLSPIKETHTIGIQTVCDKEIQTNEEFYERPQFEEASHSEAVKEIKNLKDDLFFLSESVRTCNLTSLRASQNLMGKKEGRHSKETSDVQRAEEERIKKIIEKSEASTKRAQGLKDNRERASVGMFEQSFSKNFESPAGKHQFSFKQEVGSSEKVSIGQGFYDEGLFQLVDDLEMMESRNYEFPEESESRFSDFSEVSSKKEPVMDSLEELRNRALRFKHTLKY